jgi:excisionase family DNA binding protein
VVTSAGNDDNLLKIQDLSQGGEGMPPGSTVFQMGKPGKIISGVFFPTTSGPPYWGGAGAMNAKKIPNVDASGKDFLSVKQFADLLGVHPQTVRRWLREGLIKNLIQYGNYGHYKIHRSTLVKRPD